MALRNEAGNYLKITDINGNIMEQKHLTIVCSIWETKDLRNNPTDFTKTKVDINRLDVDITSDIIDTNITIKDNIITGAYNALKTGKYTGWIDC